MYLELDDIEKRMLYAAVKSYRDIPDFRDPSSSKVLELLRAKVLVAINEK